MDEADKCNPEIVLVLKNILEGELVLSDGRKITHEEVEGAIHVHPNFRAIVLANKV